ncbi:MAG TPA: hypothetical protein VNJ01_03385 [Bacteriovoracaceae bacterium]|nr:hypothetical protein [Bacteriovoracaceae bacterium]
MNSNTTRSTKSTTELKNQVLADIKKVKEDFEEIKTRMTPGQLIDDAIYYRRGGGDPAATFDHLKRNPVGTSFLTIGTLLLMEDEYHRSYESMARDKVGVVADKVGAVRDSVGSAYTSTKATVGNVADKIGSVKDTIKSKIPGRNTTGIPESYAADSYGRLDSDRDSMSGTAESMRTSAMDGIDSAKANIREGVDAARSTVREGMDSARSTVRDGLNTVRSSLESATESVKETSREVYSSARNLDPMTYLVLGAGLGTISGAALPVSQAESRLVDDKLSDKMTLFRNDLEAALNESANILKNEFIGGFTHMNFSIF